MVSCSKNGEFLHFPVTDRLQEANSLNRCNKSCPCTKQIEAIAIITKLKCDTFDFFCKQPLHKKLALAWQIAKQL